MLLDTFGKRLKFCRAVINLQAKQLYKLVNLKVGSEQLNRVKYTQWENDIPILKNIIKKENNVLNALITIYHEHEFNNVTYNWLVYGSGFAPILEDLSLYDDDQKVFFVKNFLGKEFILRTVSGNSAEPYASLGTHLLIKTNYDLRYFRKKLVYCELKTGATYIGMHDNHTESHIYINIQNSITSIELQKIKLMGVIVWRISN